MELKEIKRKIDSVRNIWKLTGALETLSALKMKKAQKIALLSRPFAEKTAQVLSMLDNNLGKEEDGSVFFRKSPGNKALALVLASDRGFCGPFNQNILKFSEKEIKEMQKSRAIELLPVGKKAISYFKRKGYDIKRNFFGIGDFGELDDVKLISDFLVKGFLQKEYQEVYLFYTNFVSTFSQQPKMARLLPVDRENLKEFFKKEIAANSARSIDFLIEPSYKMLAEEIIPGMIVYLIYQAILEGNASEHSARMMAMRNASENAQKKAGELNLSYNKARQEQITREVSEVSSAKEALD